MPGNHPLPIHHIAYAVENLEAALPLFENLGYRQQMGGVCRDKQRNLDICFLEKDHLRLELVSIADCRQPSPIDFIFKSGRFGQGFGIPYHICYEVENLTDAVKSFKKDRYTMVTPIAAAPAIENRQVAFLFHKIMGFIELVEVAKEDV